MRHLRRNAQTIAMRPTRIGSSGAPPMNEPTDEASVRNGVRSATMSLTVLSSVAAMSPVRRSTSVTSSPSPIATRARTANPVKQRREEHRSRMASVQHAGEALGATARPGVQDGHGPSGGVLCVPPASSPYPSSSLIGWVQRPDVTDFPAETYPC